MSLSAFQSSPVSSASWLWQIFPPLTVPQGITLMNSRTRARKVSTLLVSARRSWKARLRDECNLLNLRSLHCGHRGLRMKGGEARRRAVLLRAKFAVPRGLGFWRYFQGLVALWSLRSRTLSISRKSLVSRCYLLLLSLQWLRSFWFGRCYNKCEATIIGVCIRDCNS